VIARDEEFARASALDFKPIATGFCFLEAPRVDERGVWFAECALGGIRCLRADGRIDTWLAELKPIGGLAINDDGSLLCSSPGGIVWVNPATGATGILLDTIDGKPVGGVNDIMPDGRGGLFFGTLDHAAIRQGKPAGSSALYRLNADGRVTQLCKGLKIANGIGISPDGRLLYHNESMAGTYAYELLPDGSVGEGKLLNKDLDCDGLAVDAEGGVWIACTRTGTIARVMPDGTPDRRIAIPGGHTTSICFGGSDWRDVYVTTASTGAVEVVLKGGVPSSMTGALYHARVEVPGVPVARTGFRLPTTW
jgi:sugar lactone lactonase YvrE